MGDTEDIDYSRRRKQQVECRRERLKTIEEYGEHNDTLYQHGGKMIVGDKHDPSYYGYNETQVLEDGSEVRVWSSMTVMEPYHEWVDTGTKRSWCKHCGLDSVFNGTTATYEGVSK